VQGTSVAPMSTPVRPDVHEVALQAAHAAELAPTGCAPTGCGWYHGIWPTLRLLGVVASPDRHEAFFAEALGELGGQPRVLVSGAADGAMAELVLRARTDAAITVLDRCRTPVEVAVAALARLGHPADAWVADVLDPAGTEGPFDAIVTHGLFGLLPVAERPRLALRWAALLAPGGRLITTTSVSGPDGPDPVTFAPPAIEAFVAGVEAAATEQGLPDPAALAAGSRTWAERAAVSPVRSAEDIVEALGGAGMEVHVDVREVHGSLAPGASGPWSARSARYAHVVARKPV
jgi:hypothetical protein